MGSRFVYFPTPKELQADYIYQMYGAEGLGVLYCILSSLQTGEMPNKGFEQKVSSRCWGDCFTRARQIIHNILKDPFKNEVLGGTKAELYRAMMTGKQVLQGGAA